MKNRFYLMFLLLLLASCGKHVKNLHTEETQTTSTINMIDKSLTVTTEQVDTVLKIAGIDLSAIITPSDTCDSSGIITKVVEQDGAKLTLKYDTKTKKTSAEVKKDSTEQHIIINKTTTTQNNITTIGTVEEVKKTKDVVKKSNYSIVTWGLVGFGVIVVIIFLIYLFGLPKFKR